MFGMGPTELIIVGIIAVLLFGRKLPEVAKSLGVSYREFRKGLNELQSQVNLNEIYSSTPPPRRSSTSTKTTTYGDVDDHAEATAPKFEPPASEPRPAEVAAAASGEAAATTCEAPAASGDAPALKFEPLPRELLPPAASSSAPTGEIERPIAER